MDHQKNFIKISPRKNARVHVLLRARKFTTAAHACVHRSSKKYLWWSIHILGIFFFVVKYNAAVLRPRIPQIQTAVLQVKKCGV